MSSTDSLLQHIQRASVRYFQEHANPKTGLVRDRARNRGETPQEFRYSVGSISATGFGFAVLAHASQVGLADPLTTYLQLLKTTDFLFRVSDYKGWFPHFLHWETGTKWPSSEISTIDTALFLAGALYAAKVFEGTELSRKILQLYRRVDFADMLTNGGSQPAKRTFSHGLDASGAYISSQWDSYAEHMILLVLALGSPGVQHDVWPELPVDGEILGKSLPLFVHQYSHVFVDFREFPSPQAQSLFENSRRATEHNRQSCKDAKHPNGYWGLSATDILDGYYAFAPGFDDGTLCLPCAATSIMFQPKETIADLRAWQAHPEIWGRYGLADSVNVRKNWVNPDVVGITVGPLYLAIANALGGPTIWQDFMKLKVVQEAKRKLN